MVNRAKLLIVPALVVVAGAGYFFYKQASDKAFQSNCASTTRGTCKAHREAGCDRSGKYQVSLNESGKTYTAYCDMSADGGGWMLILDYLHKAGSNPKLKIHATGSGLPTLNSSKLGDDGVATGDWGQISGDWLQKIQFSEFRFYCRTSAHARVMDFKLPERSCGPYFKTGKGKCDDVGTSGVPLSENTTYLPKTASDAFKDQGELAMDSFPFYTSRNYHWGIAGEGSRWECDDVPNGPGNSTQHLIYVR